MILKSYRVFTVLLLAFCFFGCEEGEDSAKKLDEIDAIVPTISVSEIGETIEVLTPIDITVSDNSETVNTTISINGNNVFTTTQNQFSYDIDPFEFPNGTTELIITVKDEDGNETIESFQFISNRLLFQGDGGYSSDTVDSYLAINLETSGELISFRKLIDYEDLAFYANDEFEKQDLIITNYTVSVNDGSVSAQAYANVQPGTILKTYSEVYNELGLDRNWPNNDSVFDISILDAPSYSFFTSLGFAYNFSGFSDQVFTINYDKLMANNVFIFYHTYDNLNLLDDYRYLYLDNFENQSFSFEELDKLTPAYVATINFPENVENFSFSLFGFEDDYAYKENRLRLLYSSIGLTEEKGYSFNYPIINEYQYNLKRLSYSLKNGKGVSLFRKILNDISIPDWSVVQSESILNINAEYDFSELSYEVNYSDTDNRTALLFRYHSLYEETIILPFDKLEIPTEIVKMLSDQGVNLESSSSNTKLWITLTQFENKLDFPNGVFYSPISNEVGDRTSVVFPLNN